MNLLQNLPDARSGEVVDTLHAERTIRIERIVSLGQVSPPGFWYDQPHAEWVLVLQGAARVLFADEATPRSFIAGDHLHIAAHRRHRVEWTDPAGPTVWLAVFYD